MLLGKNFQLYNNLGGGGKKDGINLTTFKGLVFASWAFSSHQVKSGQVRSSQVGFISLFSGRNRMKTMSI